MEEAKLIQVAQIYNPKENPMNGRVYSRDGIASTLRTPTGGLSEPKILEPISCAIRGRNIRAGAPTEQHLELGGDVVNCLTSVQKDSMVVEPVILTNTRTEKAKELCRQGIEDFANRERMPRDDGQKPMIIQNAHGYNKGGLFEEFSPTVTSSAFQNNNLVATRLCIRKMTPRECFRLQGMDDADIDKIDAYRIKTILRNGTVREKQISKSQKYKMAGNSIVVDVLYHIFYQMFVADSPKSQPQQLTIFD